MSSFDNFVISVTKLRGKINYKIVRIKRSNAKKNSCNQKNFMHNVQINKFITRQNNSLWKNKFFI